MISDKMRAILLRALSSEHEVYSEEYSKRSINALIKRGYLEGEDDYYEITSTGIKALGIKKTPTGKRAKTIIRKILNALSPYQIDILVAKDLPSIAGDEDHNTGRVAWHNFQDIVCAFEYDRDDELYIMAQIACDYANETGHELYIETVRHLLLFYKDE